MPKFLREYSGFLIVGAIFVFFLTTVPQPAFAQTVDPTTIWTAILTFITGPAGKILASLFVVTIGIACMVGHHPIAGIATIVGGITLIFSSQYFITTFVGG